MPDIESFFISQKNIHYGLVFIPSLVQKLHQRGDEYVCKILTEDECTQYGKIRFPKKKLEWLAGRKAAKKALLKYKLEEYAFPDVRCINIQKDHLGAPYIPEYPDLNLSISHSGEYAIAVISDYSIGVDIERTIEHWEVLLPYFFSDEEVKMLSLIHDPVMSRKKATFFWTKKEAISKLWKKGGYLNFKEIESCKEEIVFLETKIYTVSHFFEDYCISLAMKKDQK